MLQSIPLNIHLSCVCVTIYQMSWLIIVKIELYAMHKKSENKNYASKLVRKTVQSWNYLVASCCYLSGSKQYFLGIIRSSTYKILLHA